MVKIYINYRDMNDFQSGFFVDYLPSNKGKVWDYVEIVIDITRLQFSKNHSDEVSLKS